MEKLPMTAEGHAALEGELKHRLQVERPRIIQEITDARTDELIGAHLVGPNVSETVAEVVLGFEYRASADDIGGTVHAHPTLSESTKEASLAALGRALHI